MRRVLIFAIAVLLNASCTDPTPPTPTPAAAISVETEIMVLRGSAVRLDLAATDSSGAPIASPDFRVASSDSAVALPSLDRNTLVVEGRAAGSATVTVSATGTQETTHVTVVIPASQLAPTTMGVSFPSDSVRTYRGQRFVAVAVLKANGTPVWPTSAVTWQVSDPAIVRLVHSAGDTAVFEGTSAGYVTVVAKYGGLASWPVGKTVYEVAPLPVPQRVVGTQQWRDVVAHANATCATTTTGAVFCWGAGPSEPYNTYAWEPRSQPVQAVKGPVSLARQNACAIGETSGILCWGTTTYTGTTQAGMPRSASPVTATATAVAAGTSHSCLIAPDGAAWCWGLTEQGQTGVLTPAPDWCMTNNGPFYCQREPQPVAGDLRFVQLVAGDSYTCGLGEGGGAWCWGADALGGPPPAACHRAPRTGGTQPISVPCAPSPQLIAQTSDGPGVQPVFASISGATWQVCGVTTAGRAYCWDRRNVAPEPPGGSVTFTSVAAGGWHACGVTPSGSVACWGEGGRGQLGRLIESSATPLAVELPYAAIAVAAGWRHSCALLTTREIWCWGAGDLGQLGVGPGTAATSTARASMELRSQ